MDSMKFSTELSEAEQRKTINGIQVCVKEAGSGSDLVLIHGRGYMKEGMDDFFNRYKGRFHVISYDIRCHGKSTDTEVFSLDDCANDLAELVETYRLDRPQVIAFSMGSYIAMLTAEKHPNMFSKMVLIGTKGSEKASTEVLDAEQDKVRKVLLDYDLFPDMSKVTVPVLLMTGENDAVNSPKKAQAVADALPDAEFHIVPNAEHIAWFGNAQAVFAYTDEFLQQDLTFEG